MLMPSMGRVTSWKSACTVVETVIQKSPLSPPPACKTALVAMMLRLSVASI